MASVLVTWAFLASGCNDLNAKASHEEVRVDQVRNFAVQTLSVSRALEPLVSKEGSELQLWIVDHIYRNKSKPASIIGFFIVESPSSESNMFGWEIKGPYESRISSVAVKVDCGLDCFNITVVKRNCESDCVLNDIIINSSSSVIQSNSIMVIAHPGASD